MNAAGVYNLLVTISLPHFSQFEYLNSFFQKLWFSVSSVAVQTDAAERASLPAISDVTPGHVLRIDCEAKRRIKAASRRYRRLHRRYRRRHLAQRRLTRRLGRVTRQALQLHRQHQVNTWTFLKRMLSSPWAGGSTRQTFVATISQWDPSRDSFKSFGHTSRTSYWDSPQDSWMVHWDLSSSGGPLISW